MNYYEDFQGIARSSSIKLAAGEAKQLPDEACRFAILGRWSVTDDGTFTNVDTGDVLASNNEMYYGYDGVLGHQLFPGESTNLLPVNNLKQITVFRPAKTTSQTIWYTWFK